MKALKNVDMLDVIRALSQRCDGLETAQEHVEMYRRWYNEEREKVKTLKARLLECGVELED